MILGNMAEWGSNLGPASCVHLPNPLHCLLGLLMSLFLTRELLTDTVAFFHVHSCLLLHSILSRIRS